MTVFKQRLLLLASFLDALPDNRFYYDSWVGDDWAGKKDLSCGTTACAMGWATTIPELAEAGLCLVKSPHLGRGIVCLEKDAAHVRHNTNLIGQNFSLQAGLEVFGLNEYEFSYLFIPGSFMVGRDENFLLLRDISYPRSPSHKAKAKEVAGHIRMCVARKYPD